MVANAALAKTMGVPEVAVLEDGDAVILNEGDLRVERGAVPAGYVYVDGEEVGAADEVIRDRRHLADDGVLIVTIGVDLHTGEIVIGPEVDSHGVTADEDELHKLVAERVVSGIGMLEKPIDPHVLRSRVRNRARKAVREQVNRRPVVLPVVIEV